MGIIYKTINILNNKIYIGQSVYNNDNYYGSGIKLKRAILKYGKENFKKEIIEECELEKLNEKEIFWIDFYKSDQFGYNISKGSQYGWMKGLKHRKDTIEKMKISNSGEKNGFYHKKHTEETKQKISESLKNSESFQKSMKSDERKDKLRISSSKRIQSDDTKKKYQIIIKGRKELKK